VYIENPAHKESLAYDMWITRIPPSIYEHRNQFIQLINAISPIIVQAKYLY